MLHINLREIILGKFEVQSHEEKFVTNTDHSILLEIIKKFKNFLKECSNLNNDSNCYGLLSAYLAEYIKQCTLSSYLIFITVS